MMASIYGLYDASGALRYIGKANDPAARLKGHMRESRRRDTPLYRWIRKNGQPTMVVLEIDSKDWRASERRLIDEARKRGEGLLNVADGGDEPHCNPDTRRRNGLKLNNMLNSDPRAKRLREMKLQISNAIKHNQLSTNSKAKFRKLAEDYPDLFSCWKHI